MGWRFQRRVKIFPGVRINLSASGVSATFGVPGASINVGKNGAYLNAGLPGTGISYRGELTVPQVNHTEPRPSPAELISEPPTIYLPPGVSEIHSADNDVIISTNLQSVKDTLLAAHREGQELAADIKQGEIELKDAERRLRNARMVPFHDLIFKKSLLEHKTEVSDTRAAIEQARVQLQQCKVSIEVKLEPDIAPLFAKVSETFGRLQGSQQKWDITARISVDQKRERSAATESLHRSPISLRTGNLDFIDSPVAGLEFDNANGPNLLLYPGFLTSGKSIADFALVDVQELRIEFASSRFIEEDRRPTDAKQVDVTWKYVNKNGAPDKRFANNYQIPVLRYGKLRFANDQGLNEEYMFSDADAAEAFAESFHAFQRAL